MPSAAGAHSPLPGIEGFYTGLLHPLTTPAQALMVVSVGVLLGQHPPTRYQVAGPLIVILSLAGVFLGTAGTNYDPALLAVAATAAALAALIPGRLFPVTVVLVAAGAVLLGMVAVPDDGPQRDRIITMTGSLVGINLILIYACGIFWAILRKFDQPWVAIGVRIVAAWAAALSFLMLALSLTSGAG